MTKKTTETKTIDDMKVTESIETLKDMKYLRENLTKEEIIQRHIEKGKKYENSIFTMTFLYLMTILLFVVLIEVKAII